MTDEAPKITEEQLKKLPYGETPATAGDIAEEVVSLIMVINAICGRGDVNAVAEAYKAPGENPIKMAIVTYEVRLALALESWLHEEGREVLTAAGTMITEVVSAIEQERNGDS